MSDKIKDVNLKTKFKIESPLELPFADKDSKNACILTENNSVLKDAIFLGKITEINPRSTLNNYNLWCSIDFPSIIAIFGRRGTGKSFTLGNFIEGLISDESIIRQGTQKQAAILFDTLGHFWQMRHPPPKSEKAHRSILEAWGLEPKGFDNVEVFVPAGYTIRSDEWRTLQIAYTDLTLEEWCGIIQVDSFKDLMGQLMSQVFEKVTNAGWIQGEWDDNGDLIRTSNIQATDTYTPDDFVNCAQYDTEIRSRITGFAQETIRALISRLSAIGNWQVLSNNGTPITELFKPGIISVIKLNGVDDVEKQMIAGILIKKIFHAREEAKEIEEFSRIKNENITTDKLAKGWVLIDEAHNYCPQSGITASAEHIIRFAKEGRSLGLGMITTTQQPSALSSKFTSQINLLICHALSFVSDIKAAEDRLLNLELEKVIIKNESFSQSTTQKILRSLEIGQCLISSTDVNRVFISMMRPRLAAHGGGHPITSNKE